MRTFIAIELPQPIKAALENVQKTLTNAKLDIRWVRPERMHLTLKFLGDVLPEGVDPIRRTLAESVRGFGPISLSVRGSGAFPGIKNPRVIWVGLSGQVVQLRTLQQALEENLAALGFEKEKRDFKAHLTLGRIKERVDPYKLNAALNEVGGFETEPFSADRIVLFQSDLKPQGPVYTKLASAVLISASEHQPPTAL